MIVPQHYIAIDDTGLAIIADKGVPVAKLMMDKWAYELDAETLARKWPQLTLAEVYAALAYDHDHRKEIDKQVDRIDRQETIEGVNAALASIERGEGMSVREAFDMIRKRYGGSKSA